MRTSGITKITYRILGAYWPLAIVGTHSVGTSFAIMRNSVFMKRHHNHNPNQKRGEHSELGARHNANHLSSHATDKSTGRGHFNNHHPAIKLPTGHQLNCHAAPKDGYTAFAASYFIRDGLAHLAALHGLIPTNHAKAIVSNLGEGAPNHPNNNPHLQPDSNCRAENIEMFKLSHGVSIDWRCQRSIALGPCWHRFNNERVMRRYKPPNNRRPKSNSDEIKG